MAQQRADAAPGQEEIQRLRDRWNTVSVASGGILWFMPISMFWMRFVPGFRPFHFDAPAPSAGVIAGCLGLCALPYILPKSYFQPRAFERGSFYPRLGVRAFRWLAPDGGLINRMLRRKDPNYRVIQNRSALRTYIHGTYSNERGHLCLLMVGLVTMYFAFAAGERVLAVVSGLGNVVFNVYPVMHQRYKRARLRFAYPGR